MQDDTQDDSPAADPEEAARSAGLRYVGDDQPGIARVAQGEGFAYRKPNGQTVADDKTLERIRKLAIPPAWTEVWICTSPDGHLQATGRDARGRKQYRYHPRFREVRDETKYGHMMEFARALPAIRDAVSAHMALRGLPREKVLATVVHLLESTLIRVGNDDYAKENKSYGLTTLRDRHVAVEGAQLRFQFKGKSGKTWNLQLKDRRVAKVVRACQELPGQRLFQYRDESGELREVTSSDVNAYLREITGRDITAKDFRTWAGTVMAALALQEVERADTQAAAKKQVRAAIERVATRLGNTPAICRKCYVHPEVLQAHAEGELLLEISSEVEGALEKAATLRPEESAVLALLQARLSRTLEGRLADSLVALKERGKPARRRKPASARATATP
ncbi:MAG TPA: DNA topoisomerase IB [Ramlibacter sp.]|uniref:DNA topoisomerase IB n=1 Tax=Ramlibacter sp. TaxID=1917967 RepID=UPI002D624C8D|nr:DNA topoisomerase IB [Ramlibacter sp.]HZY17878.1 DNA topoisomerase IB [Ramlibacter sp.]